MTALRYMGWLTTFSVFTGLFSIIWQAFLSLHSLNKTTVLLTGLLAIESSLKRPTYEPAPKIAIGYGACTDLQINATDFLNTYFKQRVPQVRADFALDDVNNEEELLQSFAYYFQNGAAAERVMANGTLFKQLISYAKSMDKERIQWNMGGNAPVMAVRFFTEGAEVLLGAHMSKKLRPLLPKQIRLAGDEIPDDDIHLILEYKAGDGWGPYRSPRANRYILHNDKNNPHLGSVEHLTDALKRYQPQLLVVSGLQMMDMFKFKPGVREARLRQVRAQLTDGQTWNTLHHFEMASYVELQLLQQLREYVLPHVDSLGMNEQELANLQQVLEHGRTTLATDCNPRIANTLDQMRQVFISLVEDYYKQRQMDAKRRLISRIHVHTLAYQIIMTANSKWKNTRAAAAKAALTAHRYVCKSQFINPESVLQVLDDSFATSAQQHAPRMRMGAGNAVPCWKEYIQYGADLQRIEVEICVAPVLVCRVARKTAGAGDNISASGLVAQL